MSDERQVKGTARGKPREAPPAAAPSVTQPGTGKSRERPALGRFVELYLHEAYASTLREEVPQRFVELLEQLNASQGRGDGRAR
jgi:hypothetical protein